MDAPLIESGEERTLSVKQHAASAGSSSKKCYFLSLALNVVFFVSTVVLACLYLSKSDHQTHAANSAASFAADKCNFGPTHHSHIVLPLASDKASCAKQDAQFFMSHGATFFCPHTFEVKLLTTIKEDNARKVLCIHFENIESESSSKVSLRPTLPAGGLPALCAR